MGVCMLFFFINGMTCVCVCLCVCLSKAFSCVCGLQSDEDQQGDDGTERLHGSSGTAQGSTLLSGEL